jgi:hypothetical protein
MYVLNDATVDATYNYWGDPSGPYHASLNPTGKGDPVGGDGVELRFIFYLTAPIGYINQRPVARSLADKSHVSPNQQVTFFGTASTDDRRVDQYFFDFGDGQNSGWTTLSVFTHKYASVGWYNATVKVMDDFGVVSSNSASWAINCQTLRPLTVSLVPGSLSIGSGGQVSLTVQVTNGTSPVDKANVTMFSILGGSFSSSSGLTKAGYFATTFFAPKVAQATNIRIVASASKTGYADGSDYEYLTVWLTLVVNIASHPDRIYSETTTNVKVSVTCVGAPVSAATVTVSSHSTGRFDPTVGVTDANGTCAFVFTAPQTLIPLEINIVATVAKSGYLNEQGLESLTVEPKILVVQISPSSAVVNSEMPSNITVRVVYNGSSVSQATVILSSDKGGSFSPTNATTDANGKCTLVFTAPQVTTPANITITATASKTGYANGADRTTMTVNLGTLNVQVNANPVTIEPKATSTITVHVTYNARPVANAAVTVSPQTNGIFPIDNGTTNENGDCTFVFTAPQTNVELPIVIVANATKLGYISENEETTIMVTAQATGGGWSVLTILLILIPIMIAIVVAILIKLKIIVLSTEEKE